ncbi:MAG: DUF3667 domain-containing protein [Thermoanaerobaculia bacterium]
MARGRTPPCRNCGQPTGPRFCGHCGQPVDDRRRPLLRIIGEILDDWLSLDGRLLRSLLTLLRPGRLTVLHWDGKRAPHLRPLRLYLLASLALFSTVLTLHPPDAATVNLFIGDELISEATAEGSQRTVQIVDSNSFFGRRLQTSWAEKFDRFRELPPQQLLDSLFGSLRRYLPAALILFVPFLAAGLKLLYLRSKILYLDHLIFALHFQSALFFALATAWLITRILRLELGPSLLAYVLSGLLMMTVYLGMALSRVYHQRWWWTTAKALLLTFIYSQLMSFWFGIAVSAAIWQA